ncbi:MAG: hypothetical protein CMF64_12665 [Magnetovibrio sp.]|nr:hypothetical protein [Magnetovibrio sp.]
MTTRTTEKTVTFAHPFVLGGFDEVLPAGDYRVETDEELVQSLSFPVFHRLRSVIYLQRGINAQRNARVLTIDPSELDAAIARDQAAAEGKAQHPSQVKKDRVAIARGENEGMALKVPPETGPAPVETS